MRNRSHRIGVWMNDAEYQHLKRQAEVTGLGLEGLIRALVMGVQLRPRPPGEYAALLRQLSDIGTNLNQLAHVANASKAVSQDELTQAARLAREAWRIVKEAF